MSKQRVVLLKVEDVQHFIPFIATSTLSIGWHKVHCADELLCQVTMNAKKCTSQDESQDVE